MVGERFSVLRPCQKREVIPEGCVFQEQWERTSSSERRLFLVLNMQAKHVGLSIPLMLRPGPAGM